MITTTAEHDAVHNTVHRILDALDTIDMQLACETIHPATDADADLANTTLQAISRTVEIMVNLPSCPFAPNDHRAIQHTLTQARDLLMQTLTSAHAGRWDLPTDPRTYDEDQLNRQHMANRLAHLADWVTLQNKLG